MIRTISTSLKSSASTKEQGENLSIQITLPLPTDDLELSEKFEMILKDLDHHHLSEDKALRLRTFEELIRWLDKRLIQEGIFTTEIKIQINSEKSLSLKVSHQ